MTFPRKSGLVVLALASLAAVPAFTKPDKRRAPDVDQAVRWLKDYIRIDTTNPPGREEAAARYLKNILDDEGISSEIYISTPGRANLLAKLPSGADAPGPPLLLLHHMDVVPADPSEWQVDPFAGEEKDGYLWGRGALDTKVTGVLQLSTLIQLKRSGLPLNRDVYLLAVADEEAGGAWGTRWMIANAWDQLKPGFVIDEGGFGFRGLLSKSSQVVYACAVEEKKVLGLKVTAHGRGGHASLPNNENPNDILRRALARIETAFERERSRPPAVTREMESLSLRRTPLTQAMRRNTLAVTSMLSWSGDVQDPKENVIPSQAAATVDCRLLPSVNEFDLLHDLKQAVNDPRVTIEIINRTQFTAEKTNFRTPLYTALSRAIRANDPPAALVPMLYPAATDSRFFRAKGVACYGFVPVVLTEEEFSRLHAADERLPLDRLEKALGIMYDWVKNFCVDERS